MNASMRRIAGEEEARRRLARELHDDHCQRVAALGLELRVVRNQLGQDDPRRTQLDVLGQRLGELGEDLRRLSHDLHPATLEQRGLAEALRDACAEIEERQGLAIELDLGDDRQRPIPPEVALALYRIAQEGLTNAARHAQARAARLVLRSTPGALRLTLSDDGVGFPLDSARRDGGLGLASMEERARLLGGRCRIASAPGAGTTLEVSVPRRPLCRWLRRRQGWVTALALVLLVSSFGLATTMVQAQRATAQARRAEAAVRFLEGIFSAADPHQSRGTLPDARELLRRGSERVERELADQPLLRAELLEILGGIHTQLGLFTNARPLLEEALTLRESLVGTEHPEVAGTLVRLGTLANLSGQGDAVAIFRRALTIREANADREPEALADVLNKLGTAWAARGKIDEADEVFRRSLALNERLFGPVDPRVAKNLHNLSGIAYLRNQSQLAEELIGRALAIREATLAEDDPDLAGTREAVALLHRRQGRLAEAEALLEKVAATAERVWGAEHPELARTLLNLGLARAGLGKHESALQLFERAVAIVEKALAPEHPQRLRALSTLANFHLEQGRRAEAEPIFRQLLVLHKRGVAFGDWQQVLAGWQELHAANSP